MDAKLDLKYRDKVGHAIVGAITSATREYSPNRPVLMADEIVSAMLMNIAFLVHLDDAVNTRKKLKSFVDGFGEELIEQIESLQASNVAKVAGIATITKPNA